MFLFVEIWDWDWCVIRKLKKIWDFRFETEICLWLENMRFIKIWDFDVQLEVYILLGAIQKCCHCEEGGTGEGRGVYQGTNISLKGWHKGESYM